MRILWWLSSYVLITCMNGWSETILNFLPQPTTDNSLELFIKPLKGNTDIVQAWVKIPPITSAKTLFLTNNFKPSAHISDLTQWEWQAKEVKPQLYEVKYGNATVAYFEDFPAADVILVLGEERLASCTFYDADRRNLLAYCPASVSTTWVSLKSVTGQNIVYFSRYGASWQISFADDLTSDQQSAIMLFASMRLQNLHQNK